MLDAAHVLHKRVQRKREELEAYARGVERRTARRNTISIVCSALATVLVVSGVTLAQAFGPSAGPVWKTLCVLAAICSAISATCLNLVRSSGSFESIEKAHQAGKKLETLELRLALGQISQDEGLALYSQVLVDLPRPDVPARPLTEMELSASPGISSAKPAQGAPAQKH
ncbi:hypothetical protein [Archangium lipolyticum]|uniref:hypothetical protein n=1 Tax=Archangium lipolyticum TaxID=2970465 RepID=UPI00214A1ECB|nr:hypothetical protein [Archangium lipolyticum]